ncbi:MAG: hypothetical protein LBP73_04505 [Clostridiales Family XIII bacterium]|jgi:hypothetical protein|nr:hypothetical protein [Clostridiales Family XIII bacterium]
MGMKARRLAQSAFAALFCATLVAFAAASLAVHGPAMYGKLSEIALPASAREARAAFAALEDILCADLYGGTALSEAHAFVQRFMGKHETNGFEILRGEDGFLEYGRLDPDPPEIASAYAGRLWRLQSRTEAHGGKFLFISPPPRHRRYDEGTYAPGLPYPDLHALYDAVFYHLHRCGVAGIDLRAEFERAGLPFEARGFRTDDRLTAEAAFEAFRAAVGTLNRDFGAALDPDGFYENLSHYKKETYARSFLGVLGKRAGTAFGGLDDFTVLWPAFPSAYTLSIREEDGFEQTWAGPGATLLLRPSVLKAAAEARNPLRGDLYDVYMGGAHLDARIRNLSAPKGAPKLLLIHDGGGAPLAVLLAPLFREVRVVCPVASAEPDAAVRLHNRLEGFAPDYVIVESRAENLDRVLP